jgi:hypothetical protein
LNAASRGGVLLLLAAVGGLMPAAAELPGAEPSGPRRGWRLMSRSLLFFDPEGRLANEIGLGRWEETSGARVKTKVIEGGTSRSGSFAWTLDKRTTWNNLKTKVLEEQRTLRFFDPAGKELWSEEGADSLPDSPPLVFSDEEKTCLVALRRPGGWFAAAKTYLGSTLWEQGPFPKLDALQISSNGRYGLARWNDPEKSSVHSFLDLNRKVRRDVPSDRFLRGRAAIDDQGRAFSASALVFSFDPAPASTAAAPGGAP